MSTPSNLLPDARNFLVCRRPPPQTVAPPCFSSLVKLKIYGIILDVVTHIRASRQAVQALLTVGGLPSWFEAPFNPHQSSPMRSNSDVTLDEELKSGKYGVVRSLLRVLEGGTASKALLDTVIDACK